MLNKQTLVHEIFKLFGLENDRYACDIALSIIKLNKKKRELLDSMMIDMGFIDLEFKDELQIEIDKLTGGN